jgi:dsDNA-specific endonuclease/ATPase MutS2
MTKPFKIGDRIEVIDDNLEGTISGIQGDKISVKFDDGFEQEFSSNEIILSKKMDFYYSNIGFYKEQTQHKPIKSKPNKSNYIPELDLHIHELIDDARRLSNFEILNIQLSRAKNFIDWAVAKRFNKIILIHGVGQGVLKEELKTLLRRYDNLEYHDANYQKYGLGATEVKIY